MLVPHQSIFALKTLLSYVQFFRYLVLLFYLSSIVVLYLFNLGVRLEELVTKVLLF